MDIQLMQEKQTLNLQRKDKPHTVLVLNQSHRKPSSCIRAYLARVYGKPYVHSMSPPQKNMEQ